MERIVGSEPIAIADPFWRTALDGIEVCADSARGRADDAAGGRVGGQLSFLAEDDETAAHVIEDKCAAMRTSARARAARRRLTAAVRAVLCRAAVRSAKHSAVAELPQHAGGAQSRA